MISFKLRYSIQDISIPDEDIRLSFKIIHDVHVKIAKPDENYLKNSKSRHVSFCEAELSVLPQERKLKMLDDIIAGNIVDSTDDLPTPYSEITNHLGKKIIIPPLLIFPEHFKNFINQINNELADAIKRTVTIVRWYKDNRGSHSPFAVLDFKWTSDGQNWYNVPMSMHISMETITNGVKLSKKDEGIVLSLLNTDSIEPIYHSLFREAWGQRHQNPRSAIIMAISAIEVSVKHLIEKTVPDATWLVTRLQSPPVFLIFKEYLPKLSIDNKINGVTILPTDRVINDLKKWVTIRNEITHLGKKSLNGDELKEMLLTVKDILHIIDFNCGHKWSINHVRRDTLKEIGLK
ncbi:MAG: hypothetical protein O9294_16425 [Cytophagales bacterium]|jgi:hypothetical protein|nr:hypothetical protein [Cytophagales bacterium]